MSSGTVIDTDEREIGRVLDDLVRESLRALLPVTAMVGWLFAAVLRFLSEPHPWHTYAALALLLTATWASYALREQHLQLAIWVYLVGLTLAVSVIVLFLAIPFVLYTYMLVVLIASTLTNARGTWAIALTTVLLVWVIGSRWWPEQPTAVLFPACFILLTASTAWLSSHRLFTALGWTLRMTKEAQRNAQDARLRRAEVRSILKSLEEAYVRLERANQALIFAREAAEKAYRFKAEFVANVSHELRTPLNLIVGFSEMVATAPESYKGIPLPSEYRGDVMAIYRAARHLGDLINDVLDLSQIEAGRLPINRETANLAEVIGEATDIVRGLAEAKGLRLEVQLPEWLPPLYLDRTRIRQVLLNLLTNATRFTDHGWIRVCAQIDAGDVKVTVEDSGHGIPSDRLSRAFEAFSRLGETPFQEGSGLGLAVSRKFVELHGGVMWIQSVLGRGTVVGFSLPIPQARQSLPATLLSPEAPVPVSQDQPRVLVLHEDPHVLTVLNRYVDGYRFLLAENEEQARQILDKVVPVAVIVDAEWGERWRHVVAGSQSGLALPVLVSPLPNLRQLSLMLGATDYITKPVSREQLLSALARLPVPPETVLAVDDDPNFVRLLARMLKAHWPAIHVLEASGGTEGLELMQSQRPDVVLLDLLMPGLSGYDVLAEVKRNEALAGMPIILMSAHAVGQETASMPGSFRLERAAGFSLSEILQVVQASLAAVTQPAAMVRANVLPWR